MLLSLSGFLFEIDYRDQSVPFEQFCGIARSAGYGGVELRRTQVDPQATAARRREILDIVERHGLVVTCLTARGLPEAGLGRDDFLDGYLQLCTDLKCHLLKIGAEPNWLHDACERALRFRISLASNNHIDGPLESMEGTKTVLSAVNHDNFGLLYDSLHLMQNGEDYIGCIERFAPVTRNILVHSVRPDRHPQPPDTAPANRWVPALPDEQGVQNWPAIFRAFQHVGYDGLVTVIESGWPVDDREQVAHRCAQLVRQWWPQV